MNCFLQCRREIFTCLSFFAEKVYLELNCTKSTLLELLRTQILCLVALTIMRMRATRCSKASFSVEKKLLNAILRAKLKYMKNVSFWWNELFFAMQKTDFHVFELFCRKSLFLELNCTKITCLELLRTQIMCLVQPIMRMWGHKMLKASFSVEK